MSHTVPLEFAAAFFVPTSIRSVLCPPPPTSFPALCCVRCLRGHGGAQGKVLAVGAWAGKS